LQQDVTGLHDELRPGRPRDFDTLIRPTLII